MIKVVDETGNQVKEVEKLYVVKMPRNVNGHTRYSYIQFSAWSGEPIINTDIGYNFYSVLAFDNAKDAEEFMVKFLADRGRSDEAWAVYEYKPQNNSEFEFTYRPYNTKFGNCLGICGTKRIH